MDPITYPYPVEANGATYQVEQPDAPDYHRVRLPDGQVTGVPGDSSAVLTGEALAEWIANPAPAPAPVVIRTPLQILALLTPAEEAALTTSTNLGVAIVRQRLIAASEVRSDDPRTAEGAAIVVAAGIITAERVGEIFPL